MEYSERLQTFEYTGPMSLVQQCKSNVPAAYISHPWTHPELNHGLNLLQSQEAMDCYMSSYGEMHIVKCMAALQNFPFYKINGSLEIVDWGCGQGIGALCIIYALKQHEKLQWLRKVSLIEPSKAALNRAESNVKKVIGAHAAVEPLNYFLPENSYQNTLTHLTYKYTNVIHIFSNILDVKEINLRQVANILASSSQNHYILCVGPQNAGSYRIDEFYKIFQSPEVFSSISQSLYSYTQDTHHPITCKTKSFCYSGGPLYTGILKEKNYNLQNEYDVNIMIANGVLSLEAAWVWYYLNYTIKNQDDLLFISPKINGANPDFVLIKPGRAIIIIDLFYEPLSQFQLLPRDREDESPKSDEAYGVFQLKKSNNQSEDILSPIDRIANEQRIIKDSFVNLTRGVINDTSTLKQLQKVIIFTKATSSEAQSFFHRKDNYCVIAGSEFIQPNSNYAYEVFNRMHFENSQYIDQPTISQFAKLVEPEWHSYQEGIEFQLTAAQRNLVKSEEGKRQKISGVAGSGKTQVLVTRAVNAQLRTGGDILIVSYNKTLANYLRARLDMVRADFPRTKIHIYHYHDFFKENARRLNRKTTINSYQEVAFFKETDRLKKYDAIFIDEVQDFMNEWLRILNDFFLAENGELVVFGDPKQNIYGRGLNKLGEINLGVIAGVWNKTLQKSQRLTNQTLSNAAIAFQRHFMSEFMDDGLSIDKDYQPILDFNPLQYNYIENTSFSNIWNLCKNLLSQYNSHKDVVILANNRDLLRAIDCSYRKETSKETTVTFVTQEDFDNIRSRRYAYEFQQQQDLEALETIAKKTFTTATPNLKLSTIQSFKGWEAANVILLICEKDSNTLTSPALFYTAITRAKEEICVINIGNQKYHQFFKLL